jgi:hypothetical protein
MAAVLAISLYANSQPLLLSVREPYNLKQVLDLNEKALASVSPSHHSLTPHVIVHCESILPQGKSPPAYLILLFPSSGFNPIALVDFYVNPLIEALKLATGGKFSTADQLTKAV